MTSSVTFLAPYGATFSHDAYNWLARAYGAPAVSERTYVPATHNRDVLGHLIAHGGYGTIAMETDAEGRNGEPVESFIELVGRYPTNSACPLIVIGAVRMRVHFCLMARASVESGAVTHVLGHTKAFGACREHVRKLGAIEVHASSNGEAARLVSEGGTYKYAVALGPRAAAEQYNLNVLNGAFEDHDAFTTFFLVGPRCHVVRVGERNRALVVFEVPHRAGALVRALDRFSNAGLNFTHTHSMHVGNRTYHFVTEMDVPHGQLLAFEEAAAAHDGVTTRQLVFGPFEVHGS